MAVEWCIIKMEDEEGVKWERRDNLSTGRNEGVGDV